ncbi:MAG TPA: hypothetical protein VI731_06260 [Bacteroidia bacterium]|nr:hypothetical protein [Bacteroidia bacterium]
MKRLLFISCFFTYAAYGQNEVDVLRYSRIGFGGSARYSAMGGAFGALGGDASVTSTNPAGLGLYNKNELTFTPSLFSQNVISNYNGTTSEDSRYNFRIENFGMVFGSRTDNTNEKGWQSVGLAITYNRYNSFQANVMMAGEDTTSLLDHWKQTASGVLPENLDAFNEIAGWNTYLLNQVPGDPYSYTDTIPDGTKVFQRKQLTMRGGMGEWAFALAGNYSDRVYIGVSFGIPQVRYEETSLYSEEQLEDSVSAFRSFLFQQELVTKGRGFNFKAGVIYRPVDLIRIGFAFHSPTFLRMSDAWLSVMNSEFAGDSYQYDSPNGNYNYNMQTPMRMIGSLAFIFGKTASLSADVEVVDYSEGKLRAPDYAFIDANNAVRAKYTLTQNFRAGGEIRVLPFVFRAGFAYYGSPYKPSVSNNARRLYYTGGVGYRSEDDSFFVDAGVVFMNEKSNYYFYDQSLVNPVENTWKSVNTVLTIGFRY